MHMAMQQIPMLLAANGQPVDPSAGSETAWWIAFAVALAVMAGLFLFNIKTRAGIIARATTKEAVRQPVFFLLLALALILLLANTWVPFFTFGDDVKMLKDCGLATILITGMLLAVWTASVSISDEIEGKTAMTLLSKPINRRQFVVGKFLGIIQAVLCLIVPAMLFFLFLIYFKVGYDIRESSGDPPPWFAWTALGPLNVPLLTGLRLESMLQIIPGLLLIFMEICVLASVSVAISTRLPMIVNVVSCFAIFVVGHLTPTLVQQNLEQLEFVAFMARLISTLLPSLELFNMQAAVATGIIVPPDYLGFSLIYCVSYCTASILLAFILFEDRDLA